MTVPLDPGDKKLLLLSACLLALVTVAALLAPNAGENSRQGYPSSYSTASDGAKAAYMLLGELGYRVEHWTEAPGDLPEHPRNTLLIIAGPVIPATGDEVIQLRQFVSRGGRLLLTGGLATMMIGTTGVEPTPQPPGEWEVFPAEQPAPLTLHAPEITMESPVRWVHTVPGQQRYYGNLEGAVVTRFPLGKGEVIWWADDSPLTNFGITQASNLALFLNSVGPPGPAQVLWDEYFHGVRQGLWHYLGHTPVPWALAQLGLLVALALATFTRRSGAVRPLAHESRLSPMEFVVTLGSLYERRGEAVGALGIAYSHFRFLLARRLGLPSTVATAELVGGVKQRPGWAIPGFAETMEQIEAAVKLPAVKEVAALAWIGQLHDFGVRLGLESRLAGGAGLRRAQ